MLTSDYLIKIKKKKQIEYFSMEEKILSKKINRIIKGKRYILSC